MTFGAVPFALVAAFLSGVQMPPDENLPTLSGDNESWMEIDPLAHLLERLQSNLLWIDQYRINYISKRDSNESNASRQMEYLQAANDEAISYLNQLMELLVRRGILDVTKPL